MKTPEDVSISFSLLILNDLLRSKVIGDDVYDLAVSKLNETDPEPIVTKVAKKASA